MPKVLMVDVDGVLVHPVNGRHPFAELERELGLSLETLQAAFFAPYWDAIVTGREPLKDRLTEVLVRIAPGVTADQLIAYWFEQDGSVDQAIIAALAELRRDGVRIFLATNQEHLRAAHLMNTLGLGASVDGILYSAALGHRKPAAPFFQLAAERAGALSRDIVFVDDSIDNVRAARAAGWTAVHWTGDAYFRETVKPLLAA